jgi:hypothetical protein
MREGTNTKRGKRRAKALESERMAQKEKSERRETEKKYIGSRE